MEATGCGPDLFTSLCGLTSFAANAEAALTINRELTPYEVSVLCSLLVSGAEIPHLSLVEELPPGAAEQLGRAIKSASTVLITLTLSNRRDPARTPELFQTFLASANPALQQLIINNNFEGDWHDPKLEESFGRFTSLRSLKISVSSDYIYCIPLLLAAIGKLRALESLSTSRIMFRSEDAKAFAAVLNDLDMLTELEITAGFIEVEIAKAIGEVVARRRIRKLRLRLDLLQDAEVSAIVDAVLAGSHQQGSSSTRCELEELDLSINCISQTGGQKLSEGLIARSPRLRGLNLCGNSIGDATAKALRKALTQQSLEELDVNECGLGPSGVESLLGAIRPAALSVLRIGGNNPGDLGVKAIARFLRYGGRRLAKLDLQNSNITNIGALELSTAFAGIYTLRNLDMCGNVIGPYGAAAIIDALAATESVVPMDAINLQGCGVGDGGASAVGRLIARRGCKSVLLNSNGVQITGAKAIADSVSASSSCIIETLDLSQNPIGDEGVTYLLDKITQRSQPRERLVRILDITRTSMKAEGAMAVKRVVEADGVIYQLVVSRYNRDEKADKILEEVRRDLKSSENVVIVFR